MEVEGRTSLLTQHKLPQSEDDISEEKIQLNAKKSVFFNRIPLYSSFTKSINFKLNKTNHL